METKALKVYDNVVYSRMVGLGGEHFMADKDQLVNTLGIKVLYGALSTVNSDNPAYIGGGLTPSDGFHPIYEDATYQEGRVEGPTEWVCVMKRNPDIPTTATEEEITDEFTLQANTGMIVIQGSLVVDGNTINVDDYLAPTASSRQAVGTAKVILVV